MAADDSEIQFDLPFIRVYKSGRVERFGDTSLVPPSSDEQRGVASKDVAIDPQTSVSARLYIPAALTDGSAPTKRLPVLVYFHGGAFCLGSPFGPLCHTYINSIAPRLSAIIVSVDYRLAPEHPIPAAYDDSWAALKWVASHAEGGAGSDRWLTHHADFRRLFLAGDSAGGNIVHHMAMRAACERLGTSGVRINGLVMMHPYFLQGKETDDSNLVKMWKMVCPSTSGVADDDRINPMADGGPKLSGLGCERVLVCLAEKDVLRDGGRSYGKKLRESGWGGEVEIFETGGEGHMFHVFDPTSEKAAVQAAKIGRFVDKRLS